MKYSRAEASDLHWMALQLREFTSTLGTKYSYIPPKNEDLYKVLRDMVENHVVLIARKGGVRVGLIGGIVQLHPFNPEVSCLVERFWWVSPEHRNGRAGYLLLRDFMKIGEQYNCVIMALMHNSPVDDRVLKHFGLREYERTFVRES